MIGFALFTFLFIGWWGLLIIAETGVNLPNKLLKYTGINAFRGKEEYKAEDYYG